MFTDKDIDECLNKLDQIAQDIDMWDCGLPPPSEALREPIRAMLAKHTAAPVITAEKLDSLVAAYWDWQGYIEHGSGDYYNQIEEQKHNTYLRLRAELLDAAPAVPAVPQGWKPVPVEPTREMIDAMSPVEEVGYWAMYSAALNAAPASQELVPMKESQRADMVCAVAAICTGTSARTVAATAIEWTERYYGITTPAATSQESVTDEYAGVIAWIGDKQCKRVLTEGAIKHEHTPGVAMRNTAHQCVQEVIIAALCEKE